MSENFDSAVPTFLRRELNSLIPLISTDQARSLTYDLSNYKIGQPLPSSFSIALSAAQTKILSRDLNREGKHILFSAYDFGQWSSIAPIIEAALFDLRVGAITFFGGGPALNCIEERFSTQFEDCSQGNWTMSGFNSLPVNKNRSPFENTIDIAVTTVSGRFGPESCTLTNAKSILGASKLVLVYDVYGSVPNFIPAEIDKIDLVICPDSLTRDCFLETQCWQIEPQKVIISSTGQTVSAQVIQSRAEMRRQALKELRLSGSELVVAVLGEHTIERDFGQGLPKNFPETAIKSAIKTIEDLAQNNPNKNFAIILRPHPADPGKEILKNLYSAIKRLRNLEARFVETSKMDFDQVAACSDVVCSLFSTESFKAANRGIYGVFLNSIYFENLATAALTKAVSQQPLLKVIANNSELGDLLLNLQARNNLENKVNITRESQIEGTLSSILS